MEGAAQEPYEVELQAAYQRYRSAASAWRSASKAQSAQTCEAAAERLLHARVGLYRLLVASGWGPPAGVGAQVERDAALLEVPGDLEALLAG
ncbi:MAG: hypothetical protein WD794_13835 [Mycobacteriales bacterium]